LTAFFPAFALENSLKGRIKRLVGENNLKKRTQRAFGNLV
jgi:hypothetical protein